MIPILEVDGAMLAVAIGNTVVFICFAYDAYSLGFLGQYDLRA